MIRYSLKCRNDHGFESWFGSVEAFDRLLASGHLSCPACGSAHVEKALMAPRVRRTAADTAPSTAPGGPGVPSPHEPPTDAPREQPAQPAALTAPTSEREAALAALRKWVEKKSEYVGLAFAAEARRIHAGEADPRPVHGEATPEEARALFDEGVPVAPLPFVPVRRPN
jgi:hypothetical protein